MRGEIRVLPRWKDQARRRRRWRKPQTGPLPPQPPFALDLALSPDDRILAAGRRDGTIALWNIDDRHLLGKPFGAQGNEIRSVSFSPDGSLLASTNGDIKATLWDVRRGAPSGE